MPAQHDLTKLVISFDPLPNGAARPGDEAQANALYQRIVSTRRSAESPTKHGRPRRLLAVVGAAVVLGLLVPALAVGTGVLHLLGNDPAPPAVSQGLGAPAFGLAQLTTSTGALAALYHAENAFGDCLYVGTARAGDREMRPQVGFATCSSRGDDSRAIGRFSQTWQRIDGRPLEFAFGKVAPNVASLEMVFTDGRAVSVPLAGRYFLYELRNNSKAASLIARDSAGAVIDQRAIENVRPPSGS